MKYSTKGLVAGSLALLFMWGCDSSTQSELTLEELVLSGSSFWVAKDRAVFAGEVHTLSSGLHWAKVIGRPLDMPAHKIMAPTTCTMSVDAGRREAAAYARCVEAMVEVCDLGLQLPIEEGDETITTVGYNISEIHDDGSMTVVPCNPDEEE